MSSPLGTIYYTTNGTDPRAPVEIEELNRSTPVTTNTLRKVFVPSLANGGSTLGALWRTNGFNDSGWTSGQGGIGYDTTPDYLPFIGINVDAALRNQNGSIFVRIPFTVATTNQLNYLMLRVRFDDGFAAFLNGQLVASANAPTALAWNSLATAGNSDSAAVQFREFDVSAFVGALHPGENVLAIQGLNITPDSSDFLFDAELMIAQRRIVGGLPTALVYNGPIPLSDRALIKARVLNGSEWSAVHETTFIVGTPELIISELHYHPANPSVEEIAAGFTDENAFKFVELYNPGTAPFDLNGVHFVSGIDFNFTTSAITQLAPGARLLVVPNRAAFEHRYGMGLPIAGEYAGRLSNGGERVAIADASGNIIFEVTYLTGAAWPALADGSGPSLELFNLSGDRSAADHWRASPVAGGSPGLPISVEAALVSELVRDGDQLRLSIAAKAGRTYHVFVADRLTGDMVWRHERIVVPATNDGAIAVALEMPAGIPARFFKIIGDLP